MSIWTYLVPDRSLWTASSLSMPSPETKIESQSTFLLWCLARSFQPNEQSKVHQAKTSSSSWFPLLEQTNGNSSLDRLAVDGKRCHAMVQASSGRSYNVHEQRHCCLPLFWIMLPLVEGTWNDLPLFGIWESNMVLPSLMKNWGLEEENDEWDSSSMMV